MLNEKRAAARRIVNRPAKLLENPQDRMRECTIRDISDGGVRLLVPGGLSSNQFTLIDGKQRRCKVIWRLGDVIGARFEK
jgi:hypothetical protein